MQQVAYKIQHAAKGYHLRRLMRLPAARDLKIAGCM